MTSRCRLGREFWLKSRMVAQCRGHAGPGRSEDCEHNSAIRLPQLSRSRRQLWHPSVFGRHRQRSRTVSTLAESTLADPRSATSPLVVAARRVLAPMFPTRVMSTTCAMRACRSKWIPTGATRHLPTGRTGRTGPVAVAASAAEATGAVEVTAAVGAGARPSTPRSEAVSLTPR
jgi:hypothetical protein